MKSWLAGLPLLLSSAWLCSATPQPLPALPEPPQQRHAWTPSGTVPSNIHSAASALFDQGFPDPRGCEYREIDVEVSSVWQGESSRVKTGGWVMPTMRGEAQQFAICWNGCIYPVRQIGEKADLQTQATNLPPLNSRRLNNAISEVRSVFATNSSSQRLLLLLRVGETEAALRTWNPNSQLMNQFRARMRQAPDAASTQGYDPYLEFASDWAWALFDHTLGAHMRGDVPVALSSARKLAEIQSRIESEAAKRGFPRQTYYDGAREGKEKPYLEFLEQLPGLVTDLERRAHKPKERSAIETGIANTPDGPTRIAALIEDLDLVQARQWSQPGMVNLAEDPIVAALIKEGDAAVEALIECLENDKRLTRSVGFSRDFRRDRVVLAVSSAARAALQNILRVESYSGPEFRAYWKENKGMKLEDRWYAILKNDRAGYGQWLQAARSIMQPENVSGVPGGFFSTETPLKPGEKPRLRGEVLRAQANPSVSDLLLKRANVAAEEANKKDQSMGVGTIRLGCEFVEMLAQWDKPSVAVPPARSLMRHSIVLWPNPTTFIMSSGHDLARFIPQLTQIRVSGGDTNAINEYAEWIKSASDEKVDRYALEAFEPLWKNPDHPTVVSLSAWLFNDPASPWSKLPWRRSSFDDPIESELVQVSGFRRLLAREFDKRQVVGSMEYLAINSIRYELQGIGSGSLEVAWPESERPTVGTKVDLRHCDWTAWRLANSKRIPFFNPFAPIEQRDEAIKNAKALLEK